MSTTIGGSFWTRPESHGGPDQSPFKVIHRLGRILVVDDPLPARGIVTDPNLDTRAASTRRHATPRPPVHDKSIRPGDPSERPALPLLGGTRDRRERRRRRERYHVVGGVCWLPRI